MSLKSIKPKHREIMRRMLTFQPTEEIALELQVSTVYLNMLARDPLFLECMNGMEADIHDRWRANRLEAMDVLESHATKAAQLCVSAVDGLVERLDEDGGVGYDIVPLNKRLDSAWDVLNRTGNKAVEKKVVAHTTLQEMIIAAYQQRNGKGGGGNGGNGAGANRPKALAPSIISHNAEDPDLNQDLDVLDIEDEDEDEYSAFEAARASGVVG